MDCSKTGSGTSQLAFSTDLNPIEHLWNELKRRRELEEVLQEEWRKIPSETCTKFIESMPHRIEACIKNQGWPTKY